MTLFVGGPRHGGEIDDDSPTFVDLASGDTYLRKPIQFTTANEVTGRPEWTYERHVFVHINLTQPMFICHQCQSQVPQAHANTAGSIGHPVARSEPAQLVFGAAQDAIMRRWFTADGERRKATGAAAGTAGANGAGTVDTDALRAAVEVVYTATCDSCTAPDGSTPLVRHFSELRDRASWAREHIEHTGHELSFGEVTA